MKKFKILIRGDNIFLDLEGLVKRCGFYTTVFSEAPDKQSAKQNAKHLILNDKHLKEVTLNDKSDPLILQIEEISELSSGETISSERLGFCFYEDDRPIN